MKTKQTVKTVTPAIANQTAIIGGAQEMGESPWNKGKAGRKTKANPATPAKRAAVTKDKTKETAKRVPLADTRTAEQQDKDSAKASQAGRKSPAKVKKDIAPRKRGQGESHTEPVPHCGDVTAYATDIAQAGAWLKTSYLPTLREWERRLKSGEAVQGGKTALKVPTWPSFVAMLTFGAETMHLKMHAPSLGKHKPAKGKAKSRKPQARVAILQWQRENKEFMRKEITPRHERLNALMKGEVKGAATEAAMDDGKVKGRIYRGTVCLSAPRAVKG